MLGDLLKVDEGEKQRYIGFVARLEGGQVDLSPQMTHESRMQRKKQTIGVRNGDVRKLEDMR